MSNYLKIYILLTLLISTGCEDVEVAAPGNNQSNESVAPLGAIIWDENNVILDDEKVKLPENSAAGITIGRLNAIDANPDDEFNFQIKSQKVDGRYVSYFTIEKDSESNYDLETNSNIINYEALSGSKEIIITITVTDDNPDQKTSDFDITIEITNVNESPYFTNLNHIARYADEYVEYSGYRRKGEIHGEYIKYHENGNIAIRGTLNNGYYKGKWSYFNENGELIKEDLWRRGKLVK